MKKSNDSEAEPAEVAARLDRALRRSFQIKPKPKAGKEAKKAPVPRKKRPS